MSDRVARLQELLERIQRNAGRGRGVAAPVRAEAQRDAEAPPVAAPERPGRREIDPRDELWDEPAEDRASHPAIPPPAPLPAEPEPALADPPVPPPRPPTLTALLGNPVPRSARSAPPPAPSRPPARPPRSRAPSEPPRPPSIPPPPALVHSTEPVTASARPSARRTTAALRRPRPRRWLQRVGQPAGGVWATAARPALVGAVFVAAAVIVWIRREAAPVVTGPTTGGVRGAESAAIEASQPGGVSSIPARSRTPMEVAGRPTPATSAAPGDRAAATPTIDPSMLASDRALVSVRTRSRAHVYLNGIFAGPSNQTLEVGCGWRHLRLAETETPPPGRSFPVWIDDGRPVLIACRSYTQLDLVASDAPAQP